MSDPVTEPSDALLLGIWDSLMATTNPDGTPLGTGGALQVIYGLGRSADISYLLEQRDNVLKLHRRGMIYTSASTDPKHKSSVEYRCTDDHLIWPCATARALGVE